MTRIVQASYRRMNSTGVILGTTIPRTTPPTTSTISSAIILAPHAEKDYVSRATSPFMCAPSTGTSGTRTDQEDTQVDQDRAISHSFATNATIRLCSRQKRSVRIPRKFQQEN